MRVLLILLIAAAISLVLLPAHADVWSGSWTAEIVNGDIQLTLHCDKRDRSIMKRTHPASRFGNLPDIAADGPATFDLSAEAGTIRFEGSFRHGRGVGWYRLTPDRAFERQLKTLGFSRPEPEAVLAFTIEDLRLADVRGLLELGLELDDDDLLQIAIFHIDPAFVRSMEGLGWHEVEVTTLVELRIGGVDADFVRELESAGVSVLDPRDVAHLAIVGVDGQYIREMSELGYTGLSPEALLQLKVLGIDAAYIRTLDEKGLKRRSAGELVRIKALGVDEILLDRD